MDSVAPPSPPSHAGQLSHGGLTAVVLSVFFSTTATIVVGLRFWVRRMKCVGPMQEDWLQIVTLKIHPENLLEKNLSHHVSLHRQ